MTTLGSNYKTLVDLATDSDKVLMVEILQRRNPLQKLLPWVPTNDGTTGHRTKVRTGYPTPTWRRLYQGVPATKGTMVPVRETLGMMQDYGEVDVKEYELAGDDKEEWKMNEDFAHIEGMSNSAEDALFYGNTTVDPEKFNGLTARYSSLSASVATSENIVNGAGAGSDNTSIWLLGLGPQSLHALYPKGTQVGLRADDRGQQTKDMGNNEMMEVLRTHYQWDMGMSLPDWRCTGRGCNLDVSDLRTSTTAMKNLITVMIQLSERCEDPPGGQKVFAANKTVTTALRLGILEKVANNLTWETVAGQRVIVFDDMMVVRCDAISNGESVVT